MTNYNMIQTCLSIVERSHVFNLRRALKDRSASQELAGDIKSSLSSFSAAGNMHFTFGSISRNTFKCSAKQGLSARGCVKM